MKLELYQYYTRKQIFDFFAGAQPIEAEGWFASANRLIGLFAIGARPPEIHFCDDSRFHWYGQENELVPQMLQEFKDVDGPICLSSRRRTIATLTYLGSNM